MEADPLEIECPICDHKMPAEARRCPSCGVDFVTSGMDELEEVAREISDGKPPTPEAAIEETSPSPGNGEASQNAAERGEIAENLPNPGNGENGSKKEKKGLKGLFGRKRQ